MKKYLVATMVLFAFAFTFTFTTLANSAVTYGMSCDQYGDCLSSSISPSPPFLYGDQFVITISSSSGPNTTATSATSWQYDHNVFLALTSNNQATVRIIANVTGVYTVMASITYSGPGYNSTLSTSQTITIVPLHLALLTSIINITDAYGNVMRNPDGSFYRNDSFCVKWNATLQPDRADLRVNVTTFLPLSLELINYSTRLRGLYGQFCYTILPNAAYNAYNVTLVATALNSNDFTLAKVSSIQPFAVVSYQPYFSYYTYMLYNSDAFSQYQRPFITIISYDGNNPGYNYTGNSNTDQIIAPNDTNERAWINNFTFSIDGWSVNITNSHGTSNFNNYISFVKYSNLSVQVYPLNRTYRSITFSDRVQKYYFQANPNNLSSYIQQGIIYFNVSEYAWSRDFADANYSIFNSSYLYEPVFYNGLITFRAYETDGSPDPAANISVIVSNPNPLDPYLISQLQKIFGNDSTVIKAFKADLYQAYNTTQRLIPEAMGDGLYVFDINQTNLAFPGYALPYFTITVSEGGISYSYTEPDTFSLFIINNTYYTASPFSNISNLYVEPAMIAQPMNFSFNGKMPYVVWGYNSSQPFFPPEFEPGNLSTQVPYIYGSNLAVNVNLQGGGAKVVSVVNGTNLYQVTVLITPQSGGATELWAKDSSDKILANVALPDNAIPPQPKGYFGIYSISFPASENGTVYIGMTNSWGVNSTIDSFQMIVAKPSPFAVSEFLLWFFMVLIISMYFLGLYLNRHNRESATL